MSDYTSVRSSVQAGMIYQPVPSWSLDYHFEYKAVEILGNMRAAVGLPVLSFVKPSPVWVNKQKWKEVVADPLGYCDISGRSGLDEGILKIYENDVEVKRRRLKIGGGRRGEVVGFSDKSRGRLLKALNRLRWPVGPGYFLSMTFPDEFPDAVTAKSHFRALFKRIKRRYPGFDALWRQEWKRRKSGLHVGEIAPHFHFFAWGVTDSLDEFDTWVRGAWTEIAGAADAVNHLVRGTDVKLVNDRKHAVCYISKYMSKSENDAEVKGGRAWGYTSGLDFSPYRVMVLPRLVLACLRAIIEDYLLHANMLFWMKLINFPALVGFHVYGIEETVMLALIEQAAQLAHVLRDISPMRVRVGVLAGDY